MEKRAIAKYLRISPRKLQVVARAVAGISVEKALVKLSMINQNGAKLLTEVIMSAVANLGSKNAIVKSIDVSSGPVMKRFAAVSRGMAHSYRKKMSHVTVTLTKV